MDDIEKGKSQIQVVLTTTVKRKYSIISWRSFLLNKRLHLSLRNLHFVQWSTRGLILGPEVYIIALKTLRHSSKLKFYKNKHK
jgi:hypothetical protein